MDGSEMIDSRTGMGLSEDWSGVWPMGRALSRCRVQLG